MSILDQPTRALFFTGKGGMGKTSVACATAVKLARRGRRTLIISTDPASNLDEVLATPLGQVPTPVTGVEGLFALNLDPEEAVRAYRERVVGPYRGILPDATVANIEEQLSGACTLEIAAFDEFAHFLGDPAATAGFDHLIFDTAPTGHTLRLLSLPNAWTDFIDTNTTGTSCLGPLSGLNAQRSTYEKTVLALTDPKITTLILVIRPEQSAIAEAERTRVELSALGINNQQLVINGTFVAVDRDDPLARALEDRQKEAMRDLPYGLAQLKRAEIPLLSFAPVGITALASVFDPLHQAPVLPVLESGQDTAHNTLSLTSVIDELADLGHGIILTMGKGGVGKTTIAAAIATELARRGHFVHLSTTDPAAHVADTVGGSMDGLVVSRIDPEVEIAAYTKEVLSSAGSELEPDAYALLEEDLRSPCTEEIAVFRAFARIVDSAAHGFVVLDTAPTGHTLLLLEAAEAYHREVSRAVGNVPIEVAQLLPRLRDPSFTHVLLVTLPEATPVHEASRLADDLARANIEPYTWVINQSLAIEKLRDPILAARAARELPFIHEIVAKGKRCVLVPWQASLPVGLERLELLTRPK
jgi:arsenite-transporting ATPase